MQLTPFVPENIPKTQYTNDGVYAPYAKKFTGEEYLKQWKIGGGHDHFEMATQQRAASGNMPAPFEERPAKK